MLTETLREERENRLALENFTKKEIMINTDNDAADDEQAKSGIVAVQKDMDYLQQILRAEVKARLQLQEEGKERVDSLVQRVAESGRGMIRQLEMQIQRMDDSQRSVLDDLKRWVSKHTAESSQQHFRAVADHEVIMMEIRRNLQEHVTEYLTGKQRLEGDIHAVRVEADKGCTAVRAELTGVLSEAKSQFNMKTERVAQGAADANTKLKQALHRTRDKVNAKLNEQFQLIEAAKTKSQSDMTRLGKTFEGAMRKLKDIQDHQTDTTKKLVEASAQQLFGLIDNVRSTGEETMALMSSTFEKHFDERAQAHQDLREEVSSKTKMLLSKMVNLDEQERTARKQACDDLRAHTNAELISVRDAAAEQAEAVEFRVKGVEKEMAEEFASTRAEMKAALDGTWDEAEEALRAFKVEVDANLEAAYDELKEQDIMLDKKINGVEAQLDHKINTVDEKLMQEVATETASRKEADEAIKEHTAANFVSVHENARRIEEKGEDSIVALREERETAVAVVKEDLESMVYATQDEAQAAIVGISERVAAEAEVFHQMLQDDKDNLQFYIAEDAKQREEDLIALRLELTEGDEADRVAGTEALDAATTQIALEMAWFQDQALFQEEATEVKMQASMEEVDRRIRTSEHEMKEEMDVIMKGRIEALEELRKETHGEMDKHGVRLDEYQLGMMKKLELFDEHQTEERDKVKEEINGYVDAISGECHDAVMGLQDEGKLLREEVKELTLKQDEDQRLLEQSLEKGIEMVHNDCNDAVQILKSTLEESQMKMRDGMIIHEEEFETRVHALENENKDFMEQIEARINEELDKVREETDTKIGTLEDKLTAEISLKEKEAHSREKTLLENIMSVSARLDDYKEEIAKSVDSQMEGVRNVVAEAFDTLKGGMDAGFEAASTDAEQRQHMALELLEEHKTTTKESIDKLRTETGDEQAGMRIEWEAAVDALQSADAEAKAETTKVKTELTAKIEAMDKAVRVDLEVKIEEEVETLREELHATTEPMSEELATMETELKEMKEDTSAKVEDLNKKGEDVLATVDQVKAEVAASSEEDMKVVKEMIEEVDLRYAGEIEELQKVDQFIEHQVDLLEKTILGGEAQEAVAAVEGEEGGDGTAAKEAVPASEGALAKAVRELNEEVKTSLTELRGHSDAKDLELRDELTKERTESEEVLKVKLERVEMSSMQTALIAEEQAYQTHQAFEKQVAEAKEAADAADGQRNDSLEEKLEEIRTSVTEIDTRLTKVEEETATTKAQLDNTANAVAKLDTTVTDSIETIHAQISEEVGKLEGSIDAVDTMVKDVQLKQEESVAPALEKITALEESMKAVETKVESVETKQEAAAADTGGDEKLKEVEEKISKLETEVPEVEKRLGEQIAKSSTLLTEMMVTKDTMEKHVHEKDEFRRQYVDDMVAKAKEESIQGRQAITEQINGLAEKYTTEEFVIAKETEIRAYVDEKIAAVPAAESA